MIRINLIPKEDRVAVGPVGPNWSLIAALVAPVAYGLILGTVVTVQTHRALALGGLIQQEESAMEMYGPALKKIDTLTRERAEVRSRLDAMEDLDRSRRLPVRLLETVNRSVPRFLWIEKMEETNGPGLELRIKGNTFSNLIVSDFIERLEETEAFENVDLDIAKETRIGETRVVEFVLLAHGTKEALDDGAAGESVAGMPAIVDGG